MNLNKSQRVPVFLVVFAAFCIGLGCQFGWHDLISFAVGFGGAGIGILTATDSTKSDGAAPKDVLPIQ